MPNRNIYMSIAFIVNRASEEAEKLTCHCNRFTEHVCDRCRLIETLNNQVNEIITIANKEEEE